MWCLRYSVPCRTFHVAALGIATLVGCNPATTPPNPENGTASDSSLRVTDEAIQPDRTWETWDVVTLQHVPVGYQSLQVTRRENVFEGLATSQLSIHRFGQESIQSMRLRSDQQADGQVIRVEVVNAVGTRTTGQRVGQVMQFASQTTEMGDAEEAPQRWEVPLPAECGGYFAVEVSLRQNPMHPGEQRRLTALLPVLNQPAEIQLRATQEETPDWSQTDDSILRIEQQIELPGGNGTTLDSMLWVNANGAIVRSELPALGQVSFRATKEVALAAGQGNRFELGEFSTVHVPQPLPDAHRTKQIRYVVVLANGDPSKVFPDTPWQSVLPVNEQTAHITVTARQPSEGTTRSNPESVDPSDRTPSTMIESDSPVIQEMARQINRSADSSWERAKAVESFVHHAIQQKDFSTAFATAAEVAQSRQGDCTEHAVLTAALCRALNIPARVLIGLVYVPSQQGFGFHMWNEVYVAESGEWIPLDATLGMGGTGAAHLVLARSALTSSADYSSLLPVLQVLGQLEISIADASADDPS